MQTRLLTFGVWALVAASALFWGLRLLAAPTALPTQARLPAQRVALATDLQRVLGSTPVAKADEPAAAPGAGRFQLLGVVWPKGAEVSPQGVALIAVGDQPARPWRTGATLEGETVLLSVSQRAVQLGPRGGPATTTLTLPDPNQAHGSGPATTPPSMPAPGMNPGYPARSAQPVPDMAPPPLGQPGQVVVPGGATATREES